jgi:adenosylcobinamide-phosphate synthase
MVTTLRGRGVAAAAGLLADLTLGDPPAPWHPVGWFGSAMAALESPLYRDSTGAGAIYAGAGIAMARAAATACPSTTVATATSAAGRGLMRAAHAIEQQLTLGEVEKARALLPTLAGRDPTNLDETEIARAVVESVAENTVDAVVVPAWWALLGGPGGTLVHRAINTMDAMVGHRNERYRRFGCVAARLDDVAAWIPARLTVALVALVRPAATVSILAAVRRQAPAHPSPNAGVAEAAYAAALGVRLGGTNIYNGRSDHRPVLGTGPSVETRDIRRATALCRDVTVAAAALLATPAATELVRR